MNDQTRSELERLKQRHARLQEELSSLAAELQRLDSRLNTPEEAGEPQTPPSVVQIPVSPSPAATPPPLPPIITRTPRGIQTPKSESEIKAEAIVSEPAPAPTPSLAAATAARTGEAAPPRAPMIEPPRDRSFEMRLGRHWAPRIGIVMVLTALVLFGNYAYENFIVKIGPAGRVGMLYLASAILLSAGAWWQRKAASASLKNYAQVVFAGGLAAVYFTTYAAHHIDTLQIIRSPLLDGALLLAWAGFMVWIADRKQSELLALFAVGLAYYTSVITRVGSFTLYSNLVLTVAAVFFLVRNRWATLSFASLVATYAAYGFWRFFDGSNWHWATPGEGLWHGTYFLVSYWVVFSAAVFLSRNGKLAAANRATFITLNNCEFFVMFLLTMLQVRQSGFWKFALVYGAVLLALAGLARYRLAEDALAKNAYLTQGLLLVTIGFIAKFTGLKLALLLGAESVVLLTLGLARGSLVLQTGSYIAAGLAIGWGIDGLERNDWRGVYLDSGLATMMIFNATWSHWRQRASTKLIRAVPAFFCILALISCGMTTWYNTSPENFPLALAVETLALTASLYVLRLRELALLAQSLLVIGQVAWITRFIPSGEPPPWWNPAAILLITLALSHWWQRQKFLPDAVEFGRLLQGIYALAFVGLSYVWLHPQFPAPTWLALTSALAVILTVYGTITRAWFLVQCSQIFLVASVIEFAEQLLDTKPGWTYPLAPVFALGALSAGTVIWFARRPDAKSEIRKPLLQVALIYRWVALLMSLWWIQEYIGAREQFWFSIALGMVAFAWAGWRKSLEALLFSAVFTAYGLAVFWMPADEATTVSIPNLLAILVLLAEQQIARRLPERYKAVDARAQAIAILVGTASLWLLLYRWICDNGHSSYLTATWSVLALMLFACGMALRERVYRWVGLAVLALALGRVFLFDVWKFEALYRILSFMALGIVLLVLGFIYNRYQEKIKEWL